MKEYSSISSTNQSSKKQTDTNLLCYLIELRKRLIKSLLIFCVLFFITLYFANHIFTFLAQPLLKFLPDHQGLIATHITSGFFVPFDLTLIATFYLATPVFLYQLWGFVAPALYKNERRMVWPLLGISLLLFYTGILFAYFVIFPLLFNFLTHTAPVGVLIMPDIAQYLQFTLKLFLIFGAIFEVPVLTILLIWTGAVTRTNLIKKRPYAIVAAFVLGMLLAPPDVISQTLLALPLWMLYEIGLLLAPFFVKQ